MFTFVNNMFTYVNNKFTLLINMFTIVLQKVYQQNVFFYILYCKQKSQLRQNCNTISEHCVDFEVLVWVGFFQVLQ
jgi:hypothetical protein